jgi:hypothetical protein
MITGYVYYYCHNNHCYIGSTFDLKERKHTHHQRCYSKCESNKLYYSSKLYEYFRTNNLVINDFFEVLEPIEVENEQELKQHEQNYIDIFKSSGYTMLNTQCAFQTPEEKKEKKKQRDKKYCKKNSSQKVQTVKEWVEKNKEWKQCTNCKMFIFGVNRDMNDHMKSKYCLEYQDHIKQTDKYTMCDKCNVITGKYSLKKHLKTERCKAIYNMLKNI